nr:hypothetical protein [Methanobacterium formicicum]
MPDWVVHLAVAWSVCRILSFRYPQFNPANTVLVMVGSIFPDAIKISILTELVGYDMWDYIYVFHLPVGTFLLAGIAALLFREKKKRLPVFIHGNSNPLPPGPDPDTGGIWYGPLLSIKLDWIHPEPGPQR